MGGGTTIEAPKPDPQQQAYYAYMLERQKQVNTQTDAAADEEKANLAAVKSTGITGYNSYKQNLQNQYNAGIINKDNYLQNLQNYEDRYKLGTGYTQADQNALVAAATQTQAGKTKTLAGQTYQDILGRAATESEISKFQDLYKTGEYKLSDLVNSLKSGQEYQNKFNDNYLSSYYDTMYGKQETAIDPKTGLATKTGRRTFTYDSSKDPFLAGFTVAPGTSQASATASAPSSPTPASVAEKLSFTGTPAEIEEYQQALRQNRQFKIDSGLISLQGEIDKNVQKIKNQGVQDTARITGNAQMLANLTQGFWS